jgi:uncharacterized protein YbgA (DUF1722 family)
MRVWDVNPGYLNRQSLLGEHRELHAIVAVLRQRTRGYSRHPETLRWIGYGWAIRQRHRLLAAEMALRGFADQSPVRLRSRQGRWPATYVDEPCQQYAILARKYARRADGRIALPETTQQLWAQHKYSVMARDPSAYKTIGASVAGLRHKDGFCQLAADLVDLLRLPPPEGRLRNALQHLWGHVSRHSALTGREIESLPSGKFLAIIQQLAITSHEPYLTASTALSELAAWIARPA